jgi:DNA polymerase-3 subunit epsilon
MKVAFLDTETTGFEPGDHRMVEVAIILAELLADGKVRMITTYEQRLDPQRTIPPAASAVHHIFAADLIGCPTWEFEAPTITDILKRADLIVAHNAPFDMRFIDHEMARVGMKKLKTATFDTCGDARWATANGKSPTLGELCFALGVPYDPEAAHGALYDIKVMMLCFMRARAWGWFKLEESPIALSVAA